jgi:reactive chlorine resistance protein C
MATQVSRISTVSSVDGARIEAAGIMLARIGVVLCFLFIGLAKFTPEEAKGIEPLVANSPLMSWMYSVWSLQMVSNIIGVTELLAGLLLTLGTISPRAGVAGAAISTLTFLATLSFLISTPGAIVLFHGFPVPGATGQFIIKDVVLLGASVAVLGQSLRCLKRPLIDRP